VLSDLYGKETKGEWFEDKKLSKSEKTESSENDLYKMYLKKDESKMSLCMEEEQRQEESKERKVEERKE